MKSRRLTWVLASIVVVIWGTIARQFYTGVAEGETGGPAAVELVDLTRLQSEETYVYRDDVRDPFQPSPPAAKHEPLRIKRELGKSGEAVPPLKLSGILLAKSGRIAMLEGSDGSMFFAREGDTLRAIKVVRIEQQAVNYLYQNQKNKWILAR